MKKAFIYAYDHINFGDDLFVRTLVKRYPKVQFYMQSTQENKQNFSDLKNLHIIQETDFPYPLLRKIKGSLVSRYQANFWKKCAALIYIGGSIFIEYPTWENIVNWWNHQAEHYPFFVMGANFGPYKSEEYRKNMDRIFSKLKDVCFRDQYSYRLFEDNKNVRVAPDILFCLGNTDVADKRNEIVFSVIDCRKKDEGSNKLAQYADDYIRAMTALGRHYLELGKKVVYLSFCRAEGDEDAIHEIVRGLGTSADGSYEILNYNGQNSSELLERMKYAEGIVATRFHATILGLALGTPVLPVIYSDKTRHVLQDLQFDGECLDIRNMDLEKVCELPMKGFTKETIEALKQKSQAHFEKLDQKLLER